MPVLHVASLYGLHPVDLASTAAVPRLNAQLLNGLAAKHPQWQLFVVSPESKPIPGVESFGVALPTLDRVRERVWNNRYGRRVYFPRPPKMYRSSFGKWRWAEAGASRLASVLPNENSTIVICTLAEAVLASR